MIMTSIIGVAAPFSTCKLYSTIKGVAAGSPWNPEQIMTSIQPPAPPDEVESKTLSESPRSDGGIGEIGISCRS